MSTPTAVVLLNGASTATIPSGGRCAVALTITNNESFEVHVQSIRPHVAVADGIYFSDPMAARSPIAGWFEVSAGGTLTFNYDLTVRDSRALDATAPTRTIGAILEIDDTTYPYITATTATLTIDNTP